MQSIPLWPGEPPHARGDAAQDRPTLDIYEPFGRTFADAAVLILPGGGYGGLSTQEGEGYAGLFQLWGFRSFVCNYRLGTHGYRHPAMLHDAARALRTVRAGAAGYGIDPHKIVVVGSSAGGHLAATLLTKWDQGQPGHADPVERVSSRPDLGVLCYPVITLGEGTHAGSRQNLLGDNPTPEQIAELSAERHVRGDTPPCFVWHTVEDLAVPVQNAFLFVQALHAASVPFEFHCYEHGEHGLGMKDGATWSADCLRWLRRRLRAARTDED